MDGRLFYQPLRHQRALRLLKLAPGVADDPIRCSLRLARLPGSSETNPAPPKYEAVSYCWGSDVPAREIMLDGWPMMVRENLWHFLRRARYTVGERVLWVDALCINQASVRERNHQVKMMGDVYRYAETTLVWLGPEDGESDTVMDYISSFAADEGAVYVPPDLLEKALTSWVTRDYWTRTWVVQEFVLARKLQVLCGDMQTEWQILNQFYQRTKHGTMNQELSNLRLVLSGSEAFTLFDQRSMRNQSTTSFLDILARNQHRKAFDARDKVYAMLGLSADPDIYQTIEVDYEKHPRQVLLDVLRYCRVTTTDMLKQGQFLHNLLRVDEWEASNPRQVWNLRNDKVGVTTARDLQVVGFKTGEVVLVRPWNAATYQEGDILDTWKRAMIDLDNTEVALMMARLSELDQVSLRTSPESLSGFSSGISCEARANLSATERPLLSITENLNLIVVFTSFCREQQFLLGLSSGAVCSGDQLVSFIGVRRALLIRENVFDHRKHSVTGKAVCIQAPTRVSTSLSEDDPSFYRLSSSGQCTNSHKYLSMRLTSNEFLTMLG